MEITLADDSKKNAANNQFRKLRQAEEGKRAMTEYENAAVANRAKTARLRALRLARDEKEAAELAAAEEKENGEEKSRSGRRELTA
jgi:hypothetical protein